MAVVPVGYITKFYQIVDFMNILIDNSIITTLQREKKISIISVAIQVRIL